MQQNLQNGFCRYRKGFKTEKTGAVLRLLTKKGDDTVHVETKKSFKKPVTLYTSCRRKL